MNKQIISPCRQSVNYLFYLGASYRRKTLNSIEFAAHRHAAALLKNRLYRRWGIKTAREYARIKIDGLRLVGGNPDFTNAPGDEDARFYDWQQAYVHARGG